MKRNLNVFEFTGKHYMMTSAGGTCHTWQMKSWNFFPKSFEINNEVILICIASVCQSGSSCSKSGSLYPEDKRSC